jgi:hypothetical protein
MMLKQLVLFVALIFLFATVNAAFASVDIGVKAGNWIEYSVKTTGVPGEGHNVVWAKIDILSVQNCEITMNTTTKAENGSYASVIMTLNPSVGQVDVWAIIPANLRAGQNFYDRNLGNIPIMGEEQKTFGGIKRDTTFYNSTERFKRWDKATGVFLEGIDRQANFTLTAAFLRTNLWSNQIFGIKPNAFFATVIAVALAASLLTAFFLNRLKKSKSTITVKK